tara:strand:+ start:261 stop:410 length:150 start_codon:yes stop_codon:yes gene_type:complete
MPVYLRNFYYQKLVEIKEKENSEIKKSQEKARSKAKSSQTPTINPRFKR